MKVYLTKEFARFARRAGLERDALRRAAEAVAAGGADADLGGNVFKQRVARPGAGKSGGFRTLLVFRRGQDVFFVYGFAKAMRANIAPRELVALKLLAKVLLGYEPSEIARACAAGEMIELADDDDNQDSASL